MQSAANFIERIFAYNLWVMIRRFAAAPVLAASLAAFGAGARAEEPKPAPSPAVAVTPAPTPQARTPRSVFGTIMGTIFDLKKKPLSGWMVQLSSRGDDNLLRVTGTNENGQYVFKDLPAGTYDIEIQDESDALKKGRIEVRPPFRNIVDFQVGPESAAKPNPLAISADLKKKAAGEGAGAPAQGTPGEPPADDAIPPADAVKQVAVRGTFLDAQKRPVSEVSVTLVALEGKGAAYQTFSEEDGAFAIPAVPPGRYRVMVFSPGYVPIDLRSIEVRPAGGLNLRLALVDYPLNTKERPEERLPREEPVPAPSPAASTSPPS